MSHKFSKKTILGPLLAAGPLFGQPVMLNAGIIGSCSRGLGKMLQSLYAINLYKHSDLTEAKNTIINKHVNLELERKKRRQAKQIAVKQVN